MDLGWRFLVFERSGLPFTFKRQRFGSTLIELLATACIQIDMVVVQIYVKRLIRLTFGILPDWVRTQLLLFSIDHLNLFLNLVFCPLIWAAFCEMPPAPNRGGGKRCGPAGTTLISKRRLSLAPSYSGWLSGYRRCLTRRWPRFDHQSQPGARFTNFQELFLTQIINAILNRLRIDS
jgi:hypothetical protein